jgi:hypothetical protein
MTDPKPQDQQLDFVNSDKFVSIYINNVTMEVTPWDFKLICGAILQADAGGKVLKIENRAEVIMSPQHAKALLGVLNTNVLEYEKQVGEIKLPQQAAAAPTAVPAVAAKSN